jgi:hypothetical protein
MPSSPRRPNGRRRGEPAEFLSHDDWTGRADVRSRQRCGTLLVEASLLAQFAPGSVHATARDDLGDRAISHVTLALDAYA